MSDTTHAALEDAIRAHASDIGGEDVFLTDWHVVAACATADPDHTFYAYATSNTAPHAWLGLLHMALRRTRNADADEDL